MKRHSLLSAAASVAVLALASAASSARDVDTPARAAAAQSAQTAAEHATFFQPAGHDEPATGTTRPAATAQREYRERFMAAMEKNDVDGALAVLDEMEKAQPDMAGQLAGARFNLYLEKKDYDKAYQYAQQAADNNKDNPAVHNELAWTIVDKQGVEKRDLDLALKLALRADELTNHESAEILDTVARVYWEKGDQAKAVEIQTLAVEKSPEEIKAELQASLDKYKAGKK